MTPNRYIFRFEVAKIRVPAPAIDLTSSGKPTPMKKRSPVRCVDCPWKKRCHPSLTWTQTVTGCLDWQTTHKALALPPKILVLLRRARRKMMSSGFERFYSVAAICSVDATTNMHRKKTEHKPRNTLSWLWFSKKQNIVSPPQAPKKYDFRPFHLLFAFQNLKKSACGATKNSRKVTLYWVALVTLPNWDLATTTTQDRPNIFPSACALKGMSYIYSFKIYVADPIFD